MIKVTICLRRKAGMSYKEFHDYWVGHHGELAKRLAPALGIRRYVQSHSLDSPLNAAMQKSLGMEEPFDGIAETWYDSVDAFANAASTPEGKAALKALREDEKNFMDLSRSAGWLNEEHVLIEP
jgi:uncharacterized protein (TIGR02118 family)